MTAEMNGAGGGITSVNVDGGDGNTLQAGDQWQLTITHGPPNTALKLPLGGNTPTAEFQTVGTTDAQGNLTLTVTATQSQVGTRPYLAYYMQFPNSTSVSYDPSAPAGYHNALVALVSYDVTAAGAGPLLAVPPAPAPVSTAAAPSTTAPAAVTAPVVAAATPAATSSPTAIQAPTSTAAQAATTAATPASTASQAAGAPAATSSSQAPVPPASTATTSTAATAQPGNHAARHASYRAQQHAASTASTTTTQTQQAATNSASGPLDRFVPRFARDRAKTLMDYWRG